MNLLRMIFTDESTAYVGLCKFKTVKATSHCAGSTIKFNTNPRNYYATDFSKNVLL